MIEDKRDKSSDIISRLKLRPELVVLESTQQIQIKVEKLKNQKPSFLRGISYSESWLNKKQIHRLTANINKRCVNEDILSRNNIPALVTNNWLFRHLGATQQTIQTDKIVAYASPKAGRTEINSPRHLDGNLLPSLLGEEPAIGAETGAARHEIIHLNTVFDILNVPAQLLNRLLRNIDKLVESAKLKQVRESLLNSFPEMPLVNHPFCKAVEEIIAKTATVEINFIPITDFGNFNEELLTEDIYAKIGEALRQGELINSGFSLSHLSRISLAYIALGGTPLELSNRIVQEVYHKLPSAPFTPEELISKLLATMHNALDEKLISHHLDHKQLTTEDYSKLASYALTSGIERSSKIKLIALEEEQKEIQQLFQSNAEKVIGYQFNEDSYCCAILADVEGFPDARELLYIRFIKTSPETTDNFRIVRAYYDKKTLTETVIAEPIKITDEQMRHRLRKLLDLVNPIYAVALYNTLKAGSFLHQGRVESADSALGILLSEELQLLHSRKRLQQSMLYDRAIY